MAEGGGSGSIIPDYIADRLKILKRPCPVCQARSMMPCTVATDTARRNVRWFHLDREFPQEETEEECD